MVNWTVLGIGVADNGHLALNAWTKTKKKKWEKKSVEPNQAWEAIFIK